jgi:MATE family multidrug resistance protein
MTENYRRILQIAIPSIVSNITVPLLGLVDVAIVGHMGSATYIGAVAVGSMIFNLVYWLFGFLRMSTTGLTAQAYGRGDGDETTATLLHAVMTALAIAAALIVLQVPLRELMFWFIGPTADVAPLATNYFHIVIWGAPAALTLFCLTGFFIGMQNTRIPMVVSITQNLINIAISLTLVYGLDMKIEGVATGTVVAQYAALFMALTYLAASLQRTKKSEQTQENTIFQTIASLCHNSSTESRKSLLAIKRMFAVNRDLFLRTVCLVGVNLFFTAASARQGAVILSVNTVLLQLFLFFSYFMDGFANAGEALCGRYYGAQEREMFRLTLRQLFLWALLVTILFTALYVGGSHVIVALLTDDTDVRHVAREYLPWVWLIPAAGAAAFIWDGVFVGITDSRGMLFTTLLATVAFAAVYLLTRTVMGNHGLWLAQIVYLALRGLSQTVWYRRVIGMEEWEEDKDFFKLSS